MCYFSEGFLFNNLTKEVMVNPNKQLRLLYQLREKIRESEDSYQELVTENGTILIPTKVVKRSLNSSIEHYKSKFNEKKL